MQVFGKKRECEILGRRRKTLEKEKKP